MERPTGTFTKLFNQLFTGALTFGKRTFAFWSLVEVHIILICVATSWGEFDWGISTWIVFFGLLVIAAILGNVGHGQPLTIKSFALGSLSGIGFPLAIIFISLMAAIASASGIIAIALITAAILAPLVFIIWLIKKIWFMV